MLHRVVGGTSRSTDRHNSTLGVRRAVSVRYGDPVPCRQQYATAHKGNCILLLIKSKHYRLDVIAIIIIRKLAFIGLTEHCVLQAVTAIIYY